ncbi:Hypothetical predicted protein [Pelobates cultripes]|uniref:Uncharacterized protein n=1 Tax=Pelobates cultripes TaxID=61616 RepID=A0AAD1SEL6_PELCU|nr:Hypothetical predicted protein [Pelobates cultripes]
MATSGMPTPGAERISAGGPKHSLVQRTRIEHQGETNKTSARPETLQGVGSLPAGNPLSRGQSTGPERPQLHTRLDYFLTPHQNLTLLTTAEILPMTFIRMRMKCRGG